VTTTTKRASVGQTVEVRVRGIASGGAGVADLPDGRVVFVQRTAPGDVARVRVTKNRPRWAEAVLERLVTPSDVRVEPPCPVYATCGGCRLQHLSYEAQLEWKGRIIADALERIGKLGPTDPPEVVGSPDVLEYRSRVSFTLRRLRGGYVVGGYHALGRPAHVVDIEACMLADPLVGKAWGALRAGWDTGASLLPDGGRLRLTLRRTEDGVELLVEGGAEGWNARSLLDAVDGLRAIWHGTDEGTTLVAGVPGPGGGIAFEQVNRDAAALLRDHVEERISALAPHAGRAVDAYCGIGEYGRPLARMGWQVTGIEVDAAAVEEALRDAPDGFDVRTGTVEDLLPAALPVDLLVVNPPRAGLGPDVTSAIVASPPEQIVYVSCDPGTLARDIRALSGAYAVTDLRAFDLFPQTAHVETVAVLTRASGGVP
jgi:23S rRNA (uracil1939-C5)-methyltransferase